MSEQAIVNGSADPQAVALTSGEQLAIGYLHPAGASNSAFCTGTLIAPQYVATASHCVRGAGASFIGFSIGADPRNPEATFAVQQIWAHSNVDAAIMMLASDATAVHDEVVPIPFNTAPITPADIGTAVQAGGYGDTYDTNPSGRWFATVYLDDVDPTEITVDGRGDQGICYGDSGSGVIWDRDGVPVVLAVESWGDESCVDRDHMTRLDSIAEWVELILSGQAPPDPCQDLGFSGRCDGQIAEWCGFGGSATMNCGDVGGECALIEGRRRDRYACTCGNLTFQGRCNQNVIEYCDDGRARTLNCAAEGLSCSWVNDEVGYTCDQQASCSPADAAGRCVGDVLVFCEAGATQRLDCAGQGATCEAQAGSAPRCAEVVPPDREDDDDDVVQPDIDFDDLDVPEDGDTTTPTDPTADGDSGCSVASGRSTPGTLLFAVWLCLVAAVTRRTTRR